jgi:hypothetical protein
MTGPGARRRRRSISARLDFLEERAMLSAGASPAPGHPSAAIATARTTGPAQVQAALHQESSAAPTVARWRWLANTYWYVPPSNVPAVLLDTSNPTAPLLVPVPDQTVFHITGYRDGYFWGVSVVQLGPSAPVCSSMVGSVTPEGRVLLNFTPMESSSGATVTEGIGHMTQKFGQWTMENQMFTSPGSQPSAVQLQVGHWAYMVQTRPGLPSWNSLPSLGVSVPQFLSNCPSQGPQPVGS